MSVADHLEARKARGAFFTPLEITDFIAQWAIGSPTDRVLEPSCGDGEFLIAAGRRLQALGADLSCGGSLTGIDVHGPSLEAAGRRLAPMGVVPGFLHGDFFSFEASSDFDAVVGNPPFVRYQAFSGEARNQALRRALEQGVRLNGLASSWAAFLVHAAKFLKPSGRLGLVIPAELMSVKYAAEVRRFLLRRFARVRLVVFEELVFPGVQEEVVLVLAEGTGPSDHFEVFQARGLDDLPSIESRWSAYYPDGGSKWIPALLPNAPLETYRKTTTEEGFEPLLTWGDTYLGAVTGNNRFFAIPRTKVRDLDLDPSEVIPISPPGSRHLRGLALKRSHWNALTIEDRSTYLFRPRGDELSPGARRYIEAGEEIGVHEGYKCRVRTPWWRVPVVDRPHLFLTYMDRDRPRLLSNRANLYHLNSLYGVRLWSGRVRIGMDLLPVAMLNSVTLLGGEMVGRAYGGGLLKLEPNEADELPLPSLQLIERSADALRALRPQLSVALRNRRLAECAQLVDRVLLTSALGMSYHRLEGLREARQILFERRMSRSKKRAV